MGDSIFKKKRGGRGGWIWPLILLPLYLLLSAQPSGKESFLRPVWARELTTSTVRATGSENPVFPFRAGERFGYADLEANVCYIDAVLHNLSLSDTGFINYGRVPDHIVFMDTRGEFRYSIKSYGYPLTDSSGRYLYSINTDLSGLKRLNGEGELLWSLAFSSPITSIAFHEDECALGLMEGALVFVGADGQPLDEHRPEGSRMAVVLGTDITSDGSQIALISGIDPQKLTLLRRQGQQLVVQNTLKLSSDFRREVMLQFDPQGRYLHFEAEGGLGVLDINNEIVVSIPALGVMKYLDCGNEFSAASFQNESGSLLVVFRPQGTVMLSRKLEARQLYVKILENSLILGLEGFLLRSDLVEG